MTIIFACRPASIGLFILALFGQKDLAIFRDMVPLESFVSNSRHTNQILYAQWQRMRIETGPLYIFFAFTSTLPIQTRSARIEKSLQLLDLALRTLTSKYSVPCVSTCLIGISFLHCLGPLRLILSS